MLTQRQTTLDAEVVDELTQALHDEDAMVVRNATFAISRLGAKASTDEIVDRLNEKPLPLAPPCARMEHRGIAASR